MYLIVLANLFQRLAQMGVVSGLALLSCGCSRAHHRPIFFDILLVFLLISSQGDRVGLIRYSIEKISILLCPNSSTYHFFDHMPAEGYGLGELAIRRTGHREKRVCGKKIVVTLVLVCRVQDDVRVTSKSSSESG